MTRTDPHRTPSAKVDASSARNARCSRAGPATASPCHFRIGRTNSGLLAAELPGRELTARLKRKMFRKNMRSPVVAQLDMESQEISSVATARRESKPELNGRRELIKPTRPPAPWDEACDGRRTFFSRLQRSRNLRTSGARLPFLQHLRVA